jgi:hypothetical protein
MMHSPHSFFSSDRARARRVKPGTSRSMRTAAAHWKAPTQLPGTTVEKSRILQSVSAWQAEAPVSSVRASASTFAQSGLQPAQGKAIRIRRGSPRIPGL